MPAPTIESVFPSNNSVGVALGSPIEVLFDREIDLSTMIGNFLIEGPDTDRWTGPSLELYDRPDTDETEFILDSPDFTGIVRGVLSVEYVDTDGNAISNVSDPSGGSGGETPYKHRVIFTPDHILSPTTDYTVYLGGDEDTSDSLTLGISTRTVFDPVKGLNAGDGDLVVDGGYKGTIDDIFRFTITQTGSFGTSEYEWTRDSEPLIIRTGIVSKNPVAIPGGEGLVISFEGESENPFMLGDTFTVQVRFPIYMEGIYTWSFTTGSGSIVTVPSTTSTSPIGDVGSDSSVIEPLTVLSVTPIVRATNVGLTTNIIKVVFNRDIDPATVTDNSVTIEGLPVNGDPDISSSGTIAKILTVVGNVIYMILQPGVNT